jgi:hypothetical protein
MCHPVVGGERRLFSGLLLFGRADAGVCVLPRLPDASAALPVVGLKS